MLYEVITDIMQNGKDFNSLDLCFFFGVVSDSSYCYAQIADKADKQKHAIFSLNSQKITRISKRLESGVIWGYNKWHHIKIERLTALNTVKVYYDDVLLYETTEVTTATTPYSSGARKAVYKGINRIFNPLVRISPIAYIDASPPKLRKEENIT